MKASSARLARIAATRAELKAMSEETWTVFDHCGVAQSVHGTNQAAVDHLAGEGWTMRRG